MKGLFTILLLIVFVQAFAIAINQTDTLTPPDFTKISVSDFTDEELDLPYYLANFYRVANAVNMDGPNRGFINIAVWRGIRDNKPYNARIMENILSLVYFYCTNRPWNPYYGSPVLKARLEAAGAFWCSIQSKDGCFSEYRENVWGLAPTAFATKFMGEALRLLKNGPAIDKALHEKMIAADKKAIEFVLNDKAFFEHGLKYGNQYTNVFAGGLAFIDLYPDEVLKKKLYNKIKETHNLFQSPAGFFYEAYGVDWGYNLNTHHSNLLMIWQYAKGTELEKYVRNEEESYLDWLSYNVVPEPDKSGYVINRAVECRHFKPFFKKYGPFVFMGELIPELSPKAAAFVMNQEERADSFKLLRADMQHRWMEIARPASGQSFQFAPYGFLHRSHKRYFPTRQESIAAEASLAYNKPSFLHQRMDTANGMVLTFIKKPAYYAVFNSGKQVTPLQRYGLGLLWFPATGTIMQNQTHSDNAAWGTMVDTFSLVFERKDLIASFFVDGKPVSPKSGKNELTGESLLATYALDKGRKSVNYFNDRITVDIESKGKIREVLPVLLKAGDSIRIDGANIIIEKNKAMVTIKTNGTNIQQQKTTYTTGNNAVVAVQIEANDKLSYTIASPGKN